MTVLADHTVAALRPIINGSIAVIIDAVANLSCGCARNTLVEYAADASGDGSLTRADSARLIPQVFVCLTVAVIVQVIETSSAE